MRVMIALFSAITVAGLGHAEKITSVCYHPDTVSEEIPELIVITESQPLAELIPHFNRLFHESRLAIESNADISLDMRLCDDPLFFGSQLYCDGATLVRIAYNGKYLDGDGQWWELTSLFRWKRASLPVLFNTLFGQYMYEADSWLKSALLEEIASRTRRTGKEPPTRGVMTFVPAKNLETHAEEGVMAVQANTQRLISIEIKDASVRSEYQNFADQIIEDVDGSAMQNLAFAFGALFLAHSRKECKGYWTYNDEKRNDRQATTPTQEPRRIRETRIGDQDYYVIGGVRAQLGEFLVNDETDTMDKTEFEIIKRVVEAGEPGETHWTFKVHDTEHHAVVIR